jgi:hypothetical protein
MTSPRTTGQEGKQVQLRVWEEGWPEGVRSVVGRSSWTRCRLLPSIQHMRCC